MSAKHVHSDASTSVSHSLYNFLSFFLWTYLSLQCFSWPAFFPAWTIMQTVYDVPPILCYWYWATFNDGSPFDASLHDVSNICHYLATPSPVDK